MKKGNIPLYVQLEQIIRSKITTGELSPGDQILTEKELAKKYSVSLIPARQAILNLVKEGLLIRIQGKGTFVTEMLQPSKNIMTLNIKGGIKELIPQEINRHKVTVLDIVKTKVRKRIASILNIEEGQEVVKITRTRSDDDVPISYIRNFLPVEIGLQITKEDLETHTMLHVLKHKIGLPIKGGYQHIKASVADYEVASALCVDISSPIFFLETVIHSTDNTPAEVAHVFYRSDRFKYTLNLDFKETEV